MHVDADGRHVVEGRQVQLGGCDGFAVDGGKSQQRPLTGLRKGRVQQRAPFLKRIGRQRDVVVRQGRSIDAVPVGQRVEVLDRSDVHAFVVPPRTNRFS